MGSYILNGNALSLDGTTQFGSLNNPSGLDISGQITLEAWVQPSAAQGTTARIISHGPETISSYLTAPTAPYVNAITNTSELFLRIDGGTNYTVGATYFDDGTGTNNTYAATAPAPAGDLGGTAWIHLVGTYDGTNWNLFRNGVLLARQAGKTGALAVSDADWAIGATGQGWADNYSGNVDEVAIYDKALTPSQIAAHFVAGKAGTTNLSAVPAAGGKVTLTWPSGTTLESSSTVDGVYGPVAGAVSPLTVTAAGTTFYRWSLP